MEVSKPVSLPSPRCQRWEKIAWFTVWATGFLLLASAALIFGGAIYQPKEGLLAIPLSDPMALFWITVASFAHLAFVPAFCVAVALRDHRRELAGIPIPKPTSVWSGHDSVFGDAWRR